MEFSLASILPFLKGMGGGAPKESPFSAFDIGKYTNPPYNMTPPPQPQAQQMIPTPLQGAANPVPAGMEGGGNFFGDMKEFLKQEGVGRTLLQMGASQLSGETPSQTLDRGYGTWDSLQARKAAAKKAAFDQNLELAKAEDEFKNSAVGRKKDNAQAGLYGEQAVTQGAVRKKTNAEAVKALEEARKAKALANKAGVETDKLEAADTNLMEGVAKGLGYEGEDLETQAYLKDHNFVRTYNESVKKENLKVYNIFDTEEKTQLVSALNNPESPFYGQDAETIKASLNLDNIYNPKQHDAIFKYIDAAVKRRDKIAGGQKEKALKERNPGTYQAPDDGFGFEPGSQAPIGNLPLAPKVPNKVLSEIINGSLR